jgi:uncharacterized protein YecE (DUF72 family)
MTETTKTKFFIGTNAWGWKEWQGVFYPVNYKERDFLNFYSDHFNYIELRATYYKNDYENIEKWSSSVKGKHFKFCPLFPKFLRFLQDAPLDSDSAIKEFLLQWKDLAGAFILCIWYDYSIQNKTSLFSTLKRLAVHGSFVIEVKNSSWKNPSVMDELVSYANENMIALSLHDAELFNKIRTKFLYLKLDIDASPDIEKIISQIPIHLEEVYLCITGKNKIKVLRTLKELAPLQYI